MRGPISRRWTAGLVVGAFGGQVSRPAGPPGRSWARSGARFAPRWTAGAVVGAFGGRVSRPARPAGRSWARSTVLHSEPALRSALRSASPHAAPVHDLDDLCGDHVQKQGGLVTRAQLRSRLTDAQLRGLVRRRKLVPIAPGIYRRADQSVPREQAAWAAVLATGGRLIGEHLFALLDIEGGSFDVAPTVLVPPGTPRPRGLDVRLVQGALGRNETRDVLGVPAAAVPRAAVEHATDYPLRDVRRVIDSGRWLDQLTIPALLRCAVARPPDHLGGQKIRWMHEAGLFADESEGERTSTGRWGRWGCCSVTRSTTWCPGGASTGTATSRASRWSTTGGPMSATSTATPPRTSWQPATTSWCSTSRRRWSDPVPSGPRSR